MPEEPAVPSPTELAQAVRSLETSRDALLARCGSLAATTWEASDGPERWTIAQILEHLVIIERNSLRMHEKMLSQPPEPDWNARTASRDALLPRTATATVKFAAPPPLVPKGGIAPADLMAEFAAARAAVLEFAARPGQPLKEHTREHPALGPLNGYQWLLLLGHHTQRHLAQIERCAATAGERGGLNPLL